jgi:hypothetical protein
MTKAKKKKATKAKKKTLAKWPAPGFTDTEIRCHDGTEVCHGSQTTYAGVQG